MEQLGKFLFPTEIFHNSSNQLVISILLSLHQTQSLLSAFRLVLLVAVSQVARNYVLILASYYTTILLQDMAFDLVGHLIQKPR